MSNFKKIAAGTLAALTITVGALATSSTEAHAWGPKKFWGGKHLGFGIAAGVLAGAAFAAHASHYHSGVVSCRYVERYDVFGRYIGTFKKCRYL